MSDVILRTEPLGFPWPTVDPFLFCVHHDDAYPRGNDELGPAVSLAGRNIGEDFAGKDGWRMYHGDVVPGFPQHPHRGFETVTVVRQGLVDHSDSLGATARYGQGDTQWLTAGRGIVHAEMFPLVEKERDNPAELFQIWLNLPSTSKFADPHFTMFWADKTPKKRVVDAEGRGSEILVVAGTFEDATPPAPPPASWASDPEHDVAIWTLRLSPGAKLTLPKARGATTNRALYFFAGASVKIGERVIEKHAAVYVKADTAIALEAGSTEVEILLLQGKPIGQPIAQYGPFVMNTRAQIQQAFDDYQKTKFGGWPWKDDGPVHPRNEGRFAKFADGHVERANE